MPRAIRGKHPTPNATPSPLPAPPALSNPHKTAKVTKKLTFATYLPGVLVQCDASIKSIIVSIDNENNHDYIIEVLDDQNIVVKETMVQVLKIKLEERLKNTTQRVESDSET